MKESGPEQGGKNGHYISTFSGGTFDIDNPENSNYPIEDIAHALSLNCRFGGHIKQFYSVAEHSVIVSRLVDPEFAFAGLMHDSSEAFLCDVPRPIKPFLQGYIELEHRILTAISSKYGFEYPLPEQVLYIDKNMPASEAKVLFQSEPKWTKYYEHVCPGTMIQCLSPPEAEAAFLARFEELS